MRTPTIFALVASLALVACGDRDPSPVSAPSSSPTSPSPGTPAPSGPTAPPGPSQPVLQELPPPPTQQELEGNLQVDPSEADALLEQLRREIEGDV